MEFSVPKMSCGHCTAAIEKSIKAADPEASVTCDTDTHRVRVSSGLSQAAIASAISGAGYEAQAVSA